MCKIISSEAVIGNFLLESVERDNFNVSIEAMISYDEKLSEQLREYNYFTRFNFDEVLNFKENYPFFVESVESDCVRILIEDDNKGKLLNQLGRYFRIGMPRIVINEMKAASKCVYEMG